MSGRNVTTTALTVAGVTFVTGAIAYALYFDHKRRTDVEFRRELRKEKKKAQKTKQALAESTGSAGSASGSASVSQDDLRAALAAIRKEPIPATPDEKEAYFMDSVSAGEALLLQGPMFRLQAAISFYRALRVYPSPVELITIYEKTVTPAVFQLIVQMANLDTIDRVEGYYDSFPSKSMNVAVKVVDQIETGADAPKKRKTVTITKDVAAGDVIYQEHPVVAVLDLDLEGKGTHCSHCLREIPAGSAVTPDHHPLSSVYCSKVCQTKATAQYATLLFAKGPALPAELASADQFPEMQAGILMARHEAQAKFVEFLQTQCQERNVPHLLARFIARQVALETVKMMPGGATKLTEYAADLPPVDDAYGMDYSLWDHVERLRFLDVSVPDEEQEIMRMLLGTALPGLDSFINDERHQVLKGKILYNSIGITPAPSGRDDRPVSEQRPEDQEKSRTPSGTNRQIGTGLFLVSAYINHSCEPSASPIFRDGTSQLTLVANKDLKAGDEITIAYVDISQHPEEIGVEARRRRRWDLARGWRFACVCDKCLSDGAPAPGEDGTAVNSDEHDEPEIKDESKVEAIVMKAEGTSA